ncbi:hypothetical protein EXIGLDRAFT_766962 [Exidia glandulosa HHB12029]|uniref:Uncharacterized protein n=1 Tax=Exidia glandulosa HHB12029 TaxID=1314781 RepID=A0A165JD64_EXIGL|nr:hypothetical protein EXIGLDRAFT_766962 [Exidia glandulosa HHB12029]
MENALCTLNLETLECAQHLLYLFEGMPFPELVNLHLLYHRARNPNGEVEPSLPRALKWILLDERTPKLHTLFLSADSAADGTIVNVDSAAYVAALKRRPGTPKIRRLLIQRVCLVGPSEELNALTGGHELFVDSEDEGLDDWDDSNGSDDVEDL